MHVKYILTICVLHMLPKPDLETETESFPRNGPVTEAVASLDESLRITRANYGDPALPNDNY